MKIATHLLIATTVLMPLRAAAAPPEARPPEVRSPENGTHIGAPGDLYCRHEGFCDEITAAGWIPEGRSAFFVVAPRKAPGRIWVQPPIAHVNRDGTFKGLVHLGKLAEGAGEEFDIFVLACPTGFQLLAGQIIFAMPEDCEVSDAVEVTRER